MRPQPGDSLLHVSVCWQAGIFYVSKGTEIVGREIGTVGRAVYNLAAELTSRGTSQVSRTKARILYGGKRTATSSGTH
jgi:hypothetical protein